MSIRKTKAIVLRSRKQGETSKIITLYSRDAGLMKLIAKGSRSLKSRYWGALELFNCIDIVYYFKESRELQFLSQASIVETFTSVRENIGKMSQAAALCELIERSEEHASANPKLYNLLLDFLRAAEKSENRTRNLLRWAKLQFLKLAGFSPTFDSCLTCKSEDVNGDVFFLLKDGGYQCCFNHPDLNDGLMFSANSIKFLRWLQKTPIEKATTVPIPEKVGKQVDYFFLAYLNFHYEGVNHLRSSAFLDKMKHGLNY